MYSGVMPLKRYTTGNGGFTPQPPQTWSGAKQNSLPNEDDE